MSQYRLNSNGGTQPYKQNNGSAITSTSTDITVGTAKYIRDSTLLNRTVSAAAHNFAKLIAGVRGVGVADVTSVGVSNDPAFSNVNGLVGVTLIGHGLTTNDIVAFDSNGVAALGGSVFRVTSISSGNVFVINMAYTSTIGATVGATIVTKLLGTFAIDHANNFIIRKLNPTVHGRTDLVPLSSGGSDYNRRKKVHKTNAVRTTKVATAIRNNKLDPYTGRFSAGFPATSNDFSGMDIDGSDVPDDEAKAIGGNREVGGEYTYRDGGRTPQSKDYQHKAE